MGKFNRPIQKLIINNIFDNVNNGVIICKVKEKTTI